MKGRGTGEGGGAGGKDGIEEKHENKVVDRRAHLHCIIEKHDSNNAYGLFSTHIPF